MTALLHSILLQQTSLLDRVLAMFDTTPAIARIKLVNVLTIWVLTWIGWQVVKLLAKRIVALASLHPGDSPTLHEKRAKTLAQLLRSTGRGLLGILAVVLTLTQFINIAPVLGLGAAGALAVSFGAQSLVKDYFAGFFILLENQFGVGDSIEAAGKAGVVERLTLRTVTLRDVEGTIHIIPNGQITTLSNKTRGWSRAIVDVGISYDNDIDTVIKVLKEEAASLAADPDWSPRFEAAPQVLGVESFGDNGVNIRTMLQTLPGVQAEVAREFRRRVMIRLERAGIKGARAQQTINIQQAPNSSAGTPSGEPAGEKASSNPAPKPPDPNASPIPGMS
ncbi:MAG TPA: mechanosensitive ion channel family protein [Gemmatimonadales bacterium]|jgi:small conductance mechanosensitive channel